jgi:hypothetical protein
MGQVGGLVRHPGAQPVAAQAVETELEIGGQQALFDRDHATVERDKSIERRRQTAHGLGRALVDRGQHALPRGNLAHPFQRPGHEAGQDR